MLAVKIFPSFRTESFLAIDREIKFRNFRTRVVYTVHSSMMVLVRGESYDNYSHRWFASTILSPSLCIIPFPDIFHDGTVFLLTFPKFIHSRTLLPFTALFHVCHISVPSGHIFYAPASIVAAISISPS